MSNINTFSRVLLIILAISGTACQAGEASSNSTIPLPANMIGTWQVTEVHTDHKNSEQGLGDKYIIPKYLGRIITLTPARFSINTNHDDLCEKPQVISRKMKASDLFAKSITIRPFSKTRPSSEDMQLPIASDQQVNVLSLSCNGKLRSKDKGMVPMADLSNVVWFISLGNDELAMSWHDQTVLMLSRLTENTKPVASFNCAKAGTTVEKAICKSVGLAAYDKSLGQTYKHARDYYRSQNDSQAVKELSISQKTWLKQRDKCGKDIKCLQKAMDSRIGDIIYDLGDYMFQHR